MGWPLSQEYNEAVQNPRTAFADPDLRAAEVVPGPLGIPMPRSGNFADVYQVRAADGRSWAVKCFTRPVNELGQRYQAIDAHLRAARLPFSVGFQFLPEGVRIRGQWYPALKMDWVEGLTLNQFVRQTADKPDQLKALLGLWVRLCKRLRDAKIAHADLQHGNVLLVPGATANRLKLRLIDYDGMWVPALADRPSGEAGHPAYQHPARLRDRVYSPDVDRFPHLVIGCALRALAVAGKPLWDRFDNGDNLLFREADLRDPANSAVFKALWELDDPTVTNLVSLLVLSTRRPLGDTPWLDVVLDAEKPAPVSDAILAKAADVLGVERRAAQRAVPVAQLYSVPEEANEFADLGGGPLTRRRARPQSNPLLWVAAGGLGLLAAGVIGVLAWRGGHSKSTEAPPPPPVVTPAPPPDVRWVAVAPGPAVPPVPALAAGIDPEGSKAKVIRTYPPPGTSSIGGWFLPDGSRGVLAHPFGVNNVDLASGKARAVVADLGDLVRAAGSPDGSFLVIAGQDHVVHCFEAKGGVERWTATAPGAVQALAVTPDGKRVAAAGPGGLVEWASADGAEVRRHPGWKASLVAYAPDGKRAVMAGDNGVSVLNLEDGSAQVVGPTVDAQAVAVTPDGARAYAAGEGKGVNGWALADGAALPDRPRGTRYPATALAVTADGTLVVGSLSGEVLALPADGPPRTIFPGGPDAGRVIGIHVTADGRHALVASEKGPALLLRLADPPKPPEAPTSGALEQVRAGKVIKGPQVVAADPAGARLVAATSGKAVVYDAATLTELADFKVPGDRLLTATVGTNDTLLVCEGGVKPRVYAWEWATNKQTDFALPTGAGQVTTLRPVAGRRALVTTALFGDLLFDCRTGEVVDKYPAFSAKDRLVAAAGPDGDVLAIGVGNRPVKLWDAATGTLDRPCDQSVGVRALAFTPDGKRLVGLWRYGRVRVWDAGTGKLVREVEHPLSGEFEDLAPLGDELVLVTVGKDRVLLNLTTGKPVETGTPDPLADTVGAVPRLGWVLSAAEDKLTVWHASADRAKNLPDPPARPGPWPDAKLTRDAPPAPVGAGFVGKALIVAGDDGKTYRYGADGLLQDAEGATDGPIRAMAVADNKVFLLAQKGLTVRYAQTLEKDTEVKLTVLEPGPVVFEVHPDGKSILVGSDRTRLTDLGTKKETVLPNPPGKALTQFSYSANGKVGVARWGQTVTAVWKPGSGELPKTFEDLKTAEKANPDCLAVTPNGKTAILGQANGRVVTWDAGNGKKLHEEPPAAKPTPADAVVGVVALPGSKHVLVAWGDDRTIVYEIDGWTVVKTFRGLKGPRRVAVAVDGKSAVQVQPGVIQLLELPGR